MKFHQQKKMDLNNLKMTNHPPSPTIIIMIKSGTLISPHLNNTSAPTNITILNLLQRYRAYI